MHHQNNKQSKSGAHRPKNCKKKMKTPKTFKSVLPLNKVKREFFKNLVKFYESADAIAEYGGITTDTPRIAQLSEIILAFLNGEYICVCDTTRCTHLNQNVINKMRPIRRDKVAIYNALVCYMDELMGGIVNGTENELVSEITKVIAPAFMADSVDTHTYMLLCDTLRSVEEETDAANDANPNIIYVVTYTKDLTDESLGCEPEVFKTKAAALAYIREEFNKIINSGEFDPNENSANLFESSLSAVIDIYGDWYTWETYTFDLSMVK